MPINNHIPLRRVCRKCDCMFVPTGKFNRVCLKCIKGNYERSKKGRVATFKQTIKRRKSPNHYDW